MSDLPFPDWYYGGPFSRVSNPNVDLPRRANVAISDDRRQRTEQNGVLQGERIVAPFHDGNTNEDILGGLSVAMGYPAEWDDDERYVYPTIQGLLAVTRDRLLEKASRARGPKAAWLMEAISFVATASEAYARSDYQGGVAALRQVEDMVVGARRVSKRARAIHLGPGKPNDSRE